MEIVQLILGLIDLYTLIQSNKKFETVFQDFPPCTTVCCSSTRNMWNAGMYSLTQAQLPQHTKTEKKTKSSNENKILKPPMHFLVPASCLLQAQYKTELRVTWIKCNTVSALNLCFVTFLNSNINRVFCADSVSHLQIPTQSHKLEETCFPRLYYAKRFPVQ